MMQRRKLIVGAAALLAAGMTLGLHVVMRKRYAPTDTPASLAADIEAALPAG